MNDGGPAFPKPYSVYNTGNTVYEHQAQKGMTLRQWYAGMAMKGLLSNVEFLKSVNVVAKREDKSTQDLFIDMCHTYAQNMIDHEEEQK